MFSKLQETIDELSVANESFDNELENYTEQINELVNDTVHGLINNHESIAESLDELSDHSLLRVLKDRGYKDELKSILSDIGDVQHVVSNICNESIDNIEYVLESAVSDLSGCNSTIEEIIDELKDKMPNEEDAEFMQQLDGFFNICFIAGRLDTKQAQVIQNHISKFEFCSTMFKYLDSIIEMNENCTITADVRTKKTREALNIIACEVHRAINMLNDIED